MDALIIGTVNSLDFDASISGRKIVKPKKKSIKETIPFSNKTYDFSAIDGEVYWEESELEYYFEIIARNPVELEDKKREFSSWVMNVMEDVIHDPFIPDHHFKGTFEDIEFEDDESIEKTTATVKFSTYPYMIANKAKVYEFTANAGASVVAKVVNNSSHRITPTITSDVAITIELNDSSYGIASGETTDSAFMLERGVNELTITASESGTVSFSFYEEVF